MPPLVYTGNFSLVEKDLEFLSAGEVTVFLLYATNEFRDLSLTVVIAGVTDKKIEVERVNHKARRAETYTPQRQDKLTVKETAILVTHTACRVAG